MYGGRERESEEKIVECLYWTTDLYIVMVFRSPSPLHTLTHKCWLWDSIFLFTKNMRINSYCHISYEFGFEFMLCNACYNVSFIFVLGCRCCYFDTIFLLPLCCVSFLIVDSFSFIYTRYICVLLGRLAIAANLKFVRYAFLLSYTQNGLKFFYSWIERKSRKEEEERGEGRLLALPHVSKVMLAFWHIYVWSKSKILSS